MRLRLLLPFALALLPALCAPQVALSADELTELPVPTSPRALASGPDGAVWFTGSSRAVGRITATGAVTMFAAGIAGDVTPRDIAAGPGGLWFTTDRTADGDDQDDDDGMVTRVGRIATSGAVTMFDVGPRGGAAGIAAGPDGNLWFTTTGGGGAIVRMSPTGTSRTFTAGLTRSGAPRDIAVGSDGNLWFTAPGTRRIGRITPQGAITEFGAGTLTGIPQEIAAGPDGALWFTQAGVMPSIGRISTTGAISQRSTGLGMSSSPLGIASGPSGGLTFTDTGADAIARITTGGAVSVAGPALPAGADPAGITVGADGVTWVAEGGRSRIARLGAPTPPPPPPAPTTSTTPAPGPDPSAPPAETSPSPATSPAPEVDPPAETSPAPTTSAPAPAPDAAEPDPAASSPTAAPVDPSPVPASPTTDAAQAPAPTPQPALGRAAVASVVRGTVLLRLPGSSTPVAVSDASAIPSGSVIDASNGTIRLRSATDAKGRTQAAEFRGTSFRMSLSRRDVGMVDLRLTQAPTGCGTGRFAARSFAARGGSSKPVRLWGHDRGGRYRTHGQNSVATVRGTQWSTTETCAGTRTRVTSGAVSVRDVHTGKAVLVRAGRSYLARPAR